MIHSQERRKLVYSRSLHSAMNRKKRGRLCKDSWQPLSAKPTANHGDLSAIRRWFSFFVGSLCLLCRNNVPLENQHIAQTIYKQPQLPDFQLTDQQPFGDPSAVSRRSFCTSVYLIFIHTFYIFTPANKQYLATSDFLRIFAISQMNSKK